MNTWYKNFACFFFSSHVIIGLKNSAQTCCRTARCKISKIKTFSDNDLSGSLQGFKLIDGGSRAGPTT